MIIKYVNLSRQILYIKSIINGILFRSLQFADKILKNEIASRVLGQYFNSISNPTTYDVIKIIIIIASVQCYTHLDK